MPELYDLRADPMEAKNLAVDDRVKLAQLRAVLGEAAENGRFSGACRSGRGLVGRRAAGFVGSGVVGWQRCRPWECSRRRRG